MIIAFFEDRQDFFAAGPLTEVVPVEQQIDFELKQWQQVEVPLDAAEIAGLGAFTSILFGLNGDGTFFLDDIRLVKAPSEGTVIVEEYTAELPQHFTLAQNFPNPFNSGTAIRFALPEPTAVELAIYNLSGQQVMTIVQGVRQAGLHTVHWDGRGVDGHYLASGVYLYRLRAGGRTVETRKLVLVR